MRALADRVAVITGGAQGIGRALALECARAGMHVALADIDEGGMREAAELVEQQGRRAICVPTDVRERAALEHLLARTLSELGSCHLAFNNAGVMHAAAMLEAPEAQWKRVIDTNLWGVIHGSRVFGAHFVGQGEGHIVNTASAAGLFPAPGMSSYSTAKYAIVGFSQQLRWELAARGVGVTVVCPGVIRTGIGKAEGAGLRAEDVDMLIKRAPLPDGLARKVLRAVQRDRPLVRYGWEAYLVSVLRLLPQWIIDPLGRTAARQALAAPALNALPPPASNDPR